MSQLSTIYDYMRAHSNLLGERILQEYPALHQFDDVVPSRVEQLLRRPFPAQTIAIMGLAKRWQQSRTGMVVAECGTGKTLISLGAIHVHSDGNPFTALAMVPPHLVEKWAREAFLTLPGVRVPDRRLAEWRRPEQIAWRERSAIEAGPHRSRRVPYDFERTAFAQRIVECAQTLAIAVREALVVHRGS